MSANLFIIEGPDGAGKSTIVEGVIQSLISSGVSIEALSFPGKTPGTLGAHIYHFHHHYEECYGIQSINPTSLQLLHIAAHIDAIDSTIKPLLTSGTNVLLDRSWWSTLVYGWQDGADEESLKVMVDVERRHWGSTMPALGVLIDSEISHKEEQTTEQYAELRRLYRRVADEEGKHYPVEIVHNDSELMSAVDETVDHIRSCIRS